MPLFRLLGFARLGCGCLVGHYHEPSIDRDIDYVEEKGFGCTCAEHQRNQPVSVAAHAAPVGRLAASAAS